MWVLLLLLLAGPAVAQVQPDVETLSMSVTVIPPAPAGASYSTDFNGDENPLSEGGAWVNNNSGVDGKSFNRMEKYNGAAHQTLVYPRHYDGAAHLTGFPPDQWAEVTFWVQPNNVFPGGASEGTLALRMTTRATNISQAEPMMEKYGLSYSIWGSPPYGGDLKLGLWDGDSSQTNEPDTFYGRLNNQLYGHADCAGGPRPGDKLRFTVQGQSPPRLNAYIQRNDGSPEWVHCEPFDLPDNGVSSIISIPERGYGPPWHTPFLTGNPGITGFEQNDTQRRQGFSSFEAGACPPWPESCAPGAEGSGDVPNVEARCLELQNDPDPGTRCQSSETLNWALNPGDPWCYGNVADSNGSVAVGVCDPPNSSTTYEMSSQTCQSPSGAQSSGSDGGCFISGGSKRLSQVTGASVGLSVGYVTRMYKGVGSGVVYFSDKNVDYTNSTYCARSYFQFSPGPVYGLFGVNGSYGTCVDGPLSVSEGGPGGVSCPSTGTNCCDLAYSSTTSGAAGNSLNGFSLDPQDNSLCDTSPGSGDGKCAQGNMKGPRQGGSGYTGSLGSEWRSSGYDPARVFDPTYYVLNFYYNNSTYSTANFVQQPGSQVVSIGDCTDEWCSVEVCQDHNRDGDNRIHGRARVVQVSSSKTMTVATKPGIAATTSATTGSDTLAYLITDGVNNSTGDYDYLTHMMTAEKNPADRDWWIGPACEVEGGC